MLNIIYHKGIPNSILETEKTIKKYYKEKQLDKKFRMNYNNSNDTILYDADSQESREYIRPIILPYLFKDDDSLLPFYSMTLLDRETCDTKEPISYHITLRPEEERRGKNFRHLPPINSQYWNDYKPVNNRNIFVGNIIDDLYLNECKFYFNHLDSVSAIHAHFVSSSFEDTTFNSSNFYCSDFERSTFKNCTFSGSDFNKVNFGNAQFYNCRFNNCDFSGSKFVNTIIDNCIFVKCLFSHGTILTNKDETFFSNFIFSSFFESKIPSFLQRNIVFSLLGLYDIFKSKNYDKFISVISLLISEIDPIMKKSFHIDRLFNTSYYNKEIQDYLTSLYTNAWDMACSFYRGQLSEYNDPIFSNMVCDNISNSIKCFFKYLVEDLMKEPQAIIISQYDTQGFKSLTSIQLAFIFLSICELVMDYIAHLALCGTVSIADAKSFYGIVYAGERIKWGLSILQNEKDVYKKQFDFMKNWTDNLIDEDFPIV